MTNKKLPRKRGVFQVAALAGVSIATVSRAFNDPALVREDVRKRIIEAARTIGYVPNSAAKALRIQRTHIVGAVIPSLDYAIYAKLVNAFQERLAESGYTVVVLTVGFDNSQIYDRVRQVVERGAEALMVVGSIEDQGLLDLLEIKDLPWIQTYSFTPGGAKTAIGFDNGHAITQAVEHLYGLGHRHFAMIAGRTRGNDRQRSRVAAFHDCLARHGLAGAWPVIEKPYAFVDGADALAEIRRLHPRTTAIVCSSDILAVGVLHACKTAGISVPAELSVTGFDDLEFAEFTEPPLTTLSISANDMGRLAGERLAAALDQGENLRPECLPTRLVLRGSTAVPRQGAELP